MKKKTFFLKLRLYPIKKETAFLKPRKTPLWLAFFLKKEYCIKIKGGTIRPAFTPNIATASFARLTFQLKSQHTTFGDFLSYNGFFILS